MPGFFDDLTAAAGNVETGQTGAAYDTPATYAQILGGNKSNPGGVPGFGGQTWQSTLSGNGQESGSNVNMVSPEFQSFMNAGGYSLGGGYQGNNMTAQLLGPTGQTAASGSFATNPWGDLVDYGKILAAMAGGAAFGGGAEGGVANLGTATGDDLSAFYGGTDAGATLGSGAVGGAGAAGGAGSTSGFWNGTDFSGTKPMAGSSDLGSTASSFLGNAGSYLSKLGNFGKGGWGVPALRTAAGLYSFIEAQKIRRGMRPPNAGDVTSLPGYQAGLEAVQRSMASQGYSGSGNMMAALQKYGGDFYNNAATQRLQQGQAQAGGLFGNLSSLGLLASGIGGFGG